MKKYRTRYEEIVIDLINELTDFEAEVYAFIKKHGELLTSNIPPKMMGAIPNLKNKGLIEVFKRRTSIWNPKKRKITRIKEKNFNS